MNHTDRTDKSEHKRQAELVSASLSTMMVLFRAVLAVFPAKAGVHKGRHREYTLRRAELDNGEGYTLAILRQIEQGNGEAQSAARDLIDDLAPRLVLVVTLPFLKV